VQAEEKERMRHVIHAVRHGLTRVSALRARLKDNVALVAASLLVPLVSLAALSVPPRIAQGVAAPLWNAISSPLAGELSAHVVPPRAAARAASSFATRRAPGDRVAAPRETRAKSDGRASRGSGRDTPTISSAESGRPENGGTEGTGGGPIASETFPGGGETGRDARPPNARPPGFGGGGGGRPGGGTGGAASPVDDVAGRVVSTAAAAKEAAVQAATAVAETASRTVAEGTAETVATAAAGAGTLARP
jgi:hypothetical protein